MAKIPQCYFLVRSRNCYPYLLRCLQSIFEQRQRNYRILYVDDASHYSKQQHRTISNILRDHVVVFNQQRHYAVRNACQMINRYVDDEEAIVINLDGDDWLYRTDVIEIVTDTYRRQNCFLTYGNSLYFAPDSTLHNKHAQQVNPILNTRYPEEVEATGSYRRHHFRPHHLRTWKASWFKRIPQNYFFNNNKQWLRFCEDQAIMLALLEMSAGNYEVISEPLVVYNYHHDSNDVKENLPDVLADQVSILKKLPLY